MPRLAAEADCESRAVAGAQHLEQINYAVARHNRGFMLAWQTAIRCVGSRPADPAGEPST
jgi:hypothetical protein